MSSNLINKCITIKDNNETPMYHETASMNILSKKGLLIIFGSRRSFILHDVISYYGISEILGAFYQDEITDNTDSLDI